jgi:hypothetical protein
MGTLRIIRIIALAFLTIESFYRFAQFQFFRPDPNDLSLLFLGAFLLFGDRLWQVVDQSNPVVR